MNTTSNRIRARNKKRVRDSKFDKRCAGALLTMSLLGAIAIMVMEIWVAY